MQVLLTLNEVILDNVLQFPRDIVTEPNLNNNHKHTGSKFRLYSSNVCIGIEKFAASLRRFNWEQLQHNTEAKAEECSAERMKCAGRADTIGNPAPG